MFFFCNIIFFNNYKLDFYSEILCHLIFLILLFILAEIKKWLVLVLFDMN